MDMHAQPPDALRREFKRWRGTNLQHIESSSEIVDLSLDTLDTDQASQTQMSIDSSLLDQAFMDFAAPSTPGPSLRATTHGFELRNLPGLLIFPALIPGCVQVALLDKLFHRDLSDPVHKTNLHLFHEVSYPSGHHNAEHSMSDEPNSFFAADTTIAFEPKDSSVHKPLIVEQMLRRKLRWITLGGQYDWTAKEYPEEDPPPFPDDVARLLNALFPQVNPQAAIINIYSPGDTLSIHRDVSEQCERDLISISIGCDCLFLVGTEGGEQHATVRLRSGDVVLMTGPSRYAFHAVPKVLANTCPAELETWPAITEDSAYQQWKDWLKTKRININLRQMTA